MTRTPTTADATEAPAVHWISARAAARLCIVSVGVFQRLARMNGVRTWWPAGMRHPRYRIDDVRTLIATPARPRASPPHGPA